MRWPDLVVFSGERAFKARLRLSVVHLKAILTEWDPLRKKLDRKVLWLLPAGVVSKCFPQVPS